MKAILLFLLCGMLFYFSPPPPQKTISAPAPRSTPDSVQFAGQILPILQDRCNPCHFPGGKMYEKMPFDQPQTLLDHREGVLKRIKDGDAGRLMRRFLDEGAK